mmetsp:Transcript_9813/g.29912  ORF Transcript_9813/g.29912 Transcript_9813/m.29912 type:complete len:106 (+) Transcript_9813:1081-1398(+)
MSFNVNRTTEFHELYPCTTMKHIHSFRLHLRGQTKKKEARCRGNAVPGQLSPLLRRKMFSGINLVCMNPAEWTNSRTLRSSEKMKTTRGRSTSGCRRKAASESDG